MAVRKRCTMLVLLLITAVLLSTVTSAEEQLQLGVIFEINSSSTLIVTYLEGTDRESTVSSPSVYNIPPHAFSTNASTLVSSSGYYLYLSESHLLIFNNSADTYTLQPLLTYDFRSSCRSPLLIPGRGSGVVSSSLVNPVEVTALVQCESQVYGLFDYSNTNSGFRLQKFLDVSTLSKASLAVVPRSDHTTSTIGMVIDGQVPHVMFYNDLSGRTTNPEPRFLVSGINCLDSAPPLLPNDRGEMILRCPNGPSYFCTPDACKSQPIPNLAGMNELQVGFSEDISAVSDSNSINIFSNKLTRLVCSIPAAIDHQLTVTSEGTILTLINPNNITLYNINSTNGCSSIVVIPIHSTTTWRIVDQHYLVLTTANMTYNVTIFDLTTGEKKYSVYLTKMPLEYHLRLVNSAPSLSSSLSSSSSQSPLPSPSWTQSHPPSPSLTSTNSASSSVPVSSPQARTSPSPVTHNVSSAISTFSSVKSEHTSRSYLQTSLPISPTTSADSTSLPTSTARPAATFESLPLSIIIAVLTAAVVIFFVLSFIVFIGIYALHRNRRDKNVLENSSSRQTNSLSSNGNDGIELAMLTNPTPESRNTDYSTSTPSRYTTPEGATVSSPTNAYPVFVFIPPGGTSSTSPYKDNTTKLSSDVSNN